MRALLAALLLFPAGTALGLTRTSGDATVSGAMGVGTLIPRAALEIGMQTADNYALKASSVDATSIFLLDRAAKAGLGTTPTGARLDMAGRADVGEVAVELQAGNSTSSVTSAQVAFGAADGSKRHNIRTRATGDQYPGNAMDFYLWTSSDAVYALGSSLVMSLQASTTSGQGGVHVVPTTNTVTAELVVSSGPVYAGGTILAAQVVGAPCYEGIKSGIVHLGDQERRKAADDLASMRPVSFRYRGDPGHSERKGYIFEEAPLSVRSEKGAVVFDQRLMNVELTLQAARQRIARLKAEIARLEERGRP